MDLGLWGRRVLVTGASGQIGRAVALAFAAEGARVAVGYHRDEAGAMAVAADCRRVAAARETERGAAGGGRGGAALETGRGGAGDGRGGAEGVAAGGRRGASGSGDEPVVAGRRPAGGASGTASGAATGRPDGAQAGRPGEADRGRAEDGRPGPWAFPVRVDQGDEDAVAAAVAAVRREFGGVDVLVNNAVAWPPFPAPGERFETVPARRMRESVTANLLGPYLLSQAVAGGMRERGWGRIVHVSTGLAVDGRPGSAPYTTPKAGLHGLARTMSRELAPDGVLTNVVMAGFVPGDRDMPAEALRAAAEAAATHRVSTAAEIAAVIVFLCSAVNGNVTGELIRADGHFLTPA